MPVREAPESWSILPWDMDETGKGAIARYGVGIGPDCAAGLLVGSFAAAFGFFRGLRATQSASSSACRT
jgi:hypothetical protein